MLPILPGRHTHHVEVFRVDHGCRWPRVRIEVVLFIIIFVINTADHRSRGRSAPRTWWRSHRSHRAPRWSSHPNLLFSQSQLTLPQLELTLSQRHVGSFGESHLASFGYVTVVHQVAELLLQIFVYGTTSRRLLTRVTVCRAIHGRSTISVRWAGIR